MAEAARKPEAMARGARMLRTALGPAIARFLEVMELLFVSGLMVRGSAGIAGLFALLARVCYVGKIHAYAFWFVLGTLGFLAYAAYFRG